MREGAVLDIGYTTAIWGRIESAPLSGGDAAVVDVLWSETKLDGDSVPVAPDGEFPLKLIPPENHPKLPIVIQEKRPC